MNPVLLQHCDLLSHLWMDLHLITNSEYICDAKEIFLSSYTPLPENWGLSSYIIH